MDIHGIDKGLGLKPRLEVACPSPGDQQASLDTLDILINFTKITIERLQLKIGDAKAMEYITDRTNDQAKYLQDRAMVAAHNGVFAAVAAGSGFRATKSGIALDWALLDSHSKPTPRNKVYSCYL